MDTTERYAIKDLERLSGIKAHTIRIWEKRYGVIKPRRTGTNIRYYCNDDLRQILNISLLNKHGFKISAIAKMSATELVNHLSGITSVKNSTEGVQENLLLSLMELSEAKFNHAFMSVIVKLGFEKTFTEVIFPFFERIGVMWQAGTVNPAQEHFFSNIIRQKLIAATDGLELNTGSDAKSVLLLLPENELHEIGLLFYNYALRARGYKTIYLGQSVPLSGLDRVMHICTPDYVITGMTSALNPLSFKDVATQLTALLPGKKIFYTGPLAQSLVNELPDNILSVKELKELLGI
jgi:DNA-binding transcriptional MerR regulator